MDTTRRNFVRAAVAGSIGTLGILGLQSSKLEDFLTGEDKYLSPDPPTELSLFLLETIRNNSISRGFRSVYDSYQYVIDQSRQMADADPKRKQVYNGLEILGLMYQARTLREAGNNIITGEINLLGLSPIHAPKSLESPDTSFNLMKALENYTRVMRIHDQSPGQELKGKVGYRLGEYGIIASRATVNERMHETVDKLVKMNIPNNYRKSLLGLGYEGRPTQ